ncbi:MAG: MATE family efflux transporter, partial [Rhabdochlamydiaceae bacterium]
MKFQNPAIGGDFKTLIRISIPIMLFLLCEALTALCESIFLSHYSINAVHSSLNATYLAYIFQNPCMAISAMAQIYVGLYQGSGELKRIGPCVWQLIWFSLLSIFLTVPLSFWAAPFYFKETLIQEAGMQYFTILALGNFLYPLNTALTAFYLGRGKTILVTSLMLATYAFDLLLCWWLIFGVQGFIPSLGIRGAALSKCISLGLFCCFFFILFLTKKNREIYGTGQYHFSPQALWGYIQPGLVRAFGYLSARVWWVATSYLMIKKGGQYLEVQTVGGTIITFLGFITSGLYRSILTIASNLLGEKNYSEVWKLCRSFVGYVILIGAILAVPLLLFPSLPVRFFDASSRVIFERTFNSINLWIWLYLVALTLQMSFCGVLVAARDLKIQFYCSLFNFSISFIPVYLTIELRGWDPTILW